MIKTARRRSFATAFISNNTIVLSFSYNQDHVNIVTAMMGAKWNRGQRVWTVYNTTQNKDEIKQLWPDIEIIDKDAASIEETEALFEAANNKFLPKSKDVKIKDFKFVTKPFIHQKITFLFARALDCSCWWLEQGLGKTKVLIDLATWRFRKGQINICLILTTTTAVGEFEEELETHGHEDFKDLLVLDDPSTKKRQQRLEELLVRLENGGTFNGFIVTNLDALGGKGRGLRDFLIKANKKRRLFQMMVGDESSKFKHHASQRSKSAWKVGRTVKYRNILTGTLITQGGNDVFGQYRFLDERVFGTMATAFRGTYLIMGGFEEREVIGYTNVEEFFRKLYSIGIRFTKEICLDLPKKNYRRRIVRLDAKVSKLYREIEREAVSEWDGETILAPLAINRLQKAAKIVSGLIYQHDEEGKLTGAKRLHSEKMKALSEELDEASGKVTIWCHLNEEQVMVAELLTKRKIKFVEISARDKMKARKKKIKAFRTNPDIRVFLSKPTIAGHGITIVESNHVVYIGNSFNAEDRWQSEDRNHRIGQKNPVTYCDIMAVTDKGAKTYDHDVKKSLSKKTAFAKSVSLAMIARMAVRHPDLMASKSKAARAMIADLLEDEDLF